MTPQGGNPTPRGQAVALEDVHVELGATQILRGASLRVPPESTTAVLGASGAGKTTMLRAIAGLVAVSAGRVRIGGDDVTAWPPERRGVGLVFQDHLLFPHRSVAGNVGLAPRLAGAPGHEVARIVDEWLERVGLAGFGTRDVATLSGGQRQRVALARALAGRPRVVLLDEPLGALDVALREEVASQLRDLLASAAATSLLVTHDPIEATSLADRIAILDGGRIVQDGPARDVWARPVNATAAHLLGHVNVVPASELPGWGQLGQVVVPEDAITLHASAGSGQAPHSGATTASALPAHVVQVTQRGPVQRVVVTLDGHGLRLSAVADRHRVVLPGDPVEVVIAREPCVPVA